MLHRIIITVLVILAMLAIFGLGVNVGWNQSPSAKLADELNRIQDKYDNINGYVIFEDTIDSMIDSEQWDTINRDLNHRQLEEIKQAWGKYYIATNP